MLVPGTHIAVVSKNLSDGLSGRFQGWELRDTLLVLTPGPSTLYVFLFRVPLQEPTVIAQVLKTGTGGLNIDACRVATSSSDAKAMERCNTPGSGRMYASSSPIGTFIRSNSSGALDTTKGRWPSNLVLIHHAECVNEGTKRVKASAEGAGKLWSHYRDEKLDRAKAKKSTIGDKDGLETIQAWTCHPNCPVGLLDRQSGVLKSGKDINPTQGPVQGFFGAGQRYYSAMANYGDSGGASRFYPQFKNLSECLDWINKLINS